MKSIARWFDVRNVPTLDDMRCEVLLSLLGAAIIGVFLLLGKTLFSFLVIDSIQLPSHLVGIITGLWILVICFHYVKWGRIDWAGGVFFLFSIIGIPLYFPADRINDILPVFLLPPIAASLLINSFSSLLFSFISWVTYTLWFLYGGVEGEGYNFIFVVILIIVACFCWLLSEWFRRLIQERETSERKSLALVEQSPVIIYQVESCRSKQWTYISPQIEKWLGFSQTEWLESQGLWAQQIHPEDRERILSIDQGGGDPGAGFSQEYRMFTQDGRMIWVLDTSQPVVDDPDHTFQQGTLQDITDRKQSEQMQKAIYRIAEAAFSAHNLSDLYQLIHHVLSDLMPAENFFIASYHSEDEMISFDYFVDTYDIPPPPRKIGRTLTDYILRTGEPCFVSPDDFRALERLGEVESQGTPSLDWLGVPLKERGRTIGVMVVQSYKEGVRFTEEQLDMMVFVSNQIAMAIERRRADENMKSALEEKEVLLREIHHRVKNNLQVITSLISLQADHINDPQIADAFLETQARVRSMSLIHEELYQASNLAQVNFPDYLQRLTGYLTNAFAIGGRITLQTDVKDVLLGVDTAIPLGLIVNELVSNALKHAFPDGRRGKIIVRLHPVINQSGEHWYDLVVEDNGAGFPHDIDHRKTETLGLQLVSVLSRQLKGTIELENNGGTKFILRFPEPKGLING